MDGSEDFGFHMDRGGGLDQSKLMNVCGPWSWLSRAESIKGENCSIERKRK